MSDVTESTIAMIPIKKLKDSSGNYYPLGIFESVVTSHDIKLNANFGTYKAGDVIPERTSLDEILANLVAYDKHILKDNIDLTVLSNDTDRVPSSYLVGNLLKSGSAYVKKEDANADLSVPSGWYVTGIKQIEGKIDSLYRAQLGDAATAGIDKLESSPVTFENITDDYSAEDAMIPSSLLTRTTIEFLANKLKNLIGSAKYIGKTQDEDQNYPLTQPDILYLNDGTTINSYNEGYIVNYRDSLYVYYKSKWIPFTELEIYTGTTVPKRYDSDQSKEIDDTSKLWLDTSKSHIIEPQSSSETAVRSDIMALKALLSKIQIGFNELYRIVMLGAVPGSVDDNYKSKLTQIDLSDDINENIPNDIKRSDTLVGLKIFGNTYVGNGSQYTVIYNPSGTTKTDVLWSFSGCEEEEFVATQTKTVKELAIEYVNSEADRNFYAFRMTPAGGVDKESEYSSKADAIAAINECADTTKIVALKKQQIKITGYISATKEETIAWINTLDPDTEITLRVNNQLQQFVSTETETAKEQALAYVSELSDTDNIEYAKLYSMNISNYTAQTCTINIPDVNMLIVCDNNVELAVRSTQVYEEESTTFINTVQTITVGGEKPIPEEDGEPTIPAVCAKKDTASNFAIAMQQGKLIDGEICFYTDQGKFAIYYGGRFYTLKSATTDTDALDINKLQNTPLEYLLFNNGDTVYKVYVDSLGEWRVTPYDSNYPAVNYQVNSIGSKQVSDVWINSRVCISSIYCGGGETGNNNYIDKQCLVSHNFVELANSTDETVKLDGCVLLYTNGSLSETNGFVWEKLNLTGVIKPRSTFLIRGTRCNDDNDSLIVVDKFDMEWKNSEGKLVAFKNDPTVNTNGCGFFLCTGAYDANSNTLKLKDFWQNKLESNTLKDIWQQSKTACVDGYVDCCGMVQSTGCRYVPSEGETTSGGVTSGTSLGCDGNDFRKIMFVRWYTLDPSKQSLKKYIERKTTTFWTYIKLEAQTTRLGNHIQYYYPDFIKQRYAPKSSKENKSFFSVQTKFDESKPNVINVTFGAQATETITSGHRNNDASRCFNWISVGNYDEYVEYRKLYNDRGIVSSLPEISEYSINDLVTLSTTNTKYYFNGTEWKSCISGTVNYSDDLVRNGYFYQQDIPGSTTNGKYVFVHNNWIKEIQGTAVNNYSDLSNDIKSNVIGTVKYVTASKTEYVWIGAEWITTTSIGKITSVSDLPKSIDNGDIYKCIKTDQYFEWDGYNWNEVINGWTRKYSITKDNVNDSQEIKEFYDYYARYRWTTPYGSWVTTHKAILKGLSKGNYQYRVSRDDNESYVSDICRFEVKDDIDVSTFSMIQTSDQQGFNWMEYQVWKKAAYQINKTNKDTYDFTINTGDIAQSGNRPNEWIDYFDGKQYINDKVEMFTVGNNDLCGRVSSKLTDGDDSTSKYNHINSQRYFAFELDINNYTYDSDANKRISNYYVSWLDRKSNSYFTPMYCLYSYNYGKYHFISLNSENCNFSIKTYTDIYDSDASTSTDLNIFADTANRQIEKWFQKDLMIWTNSDDAENIKDCSKCIIYMHHMPFTLATDSYFNKGTDRSDNGSALNIYNLFGGYRFTRLFKKYGIRMILGGHKHTFTIPYCIYDAPSHMYPSFCFDYDNLPYGTSNQNNTNNLCDICNVTTQAFDYLWNGSSWEAYVNIDDVSGSELPSEVKLNKIYRLKSIGQNYVGLNTGTISEPDNKWIKLISEPITGKVADYNNLPTATASNNDIYIVNNSHKKYKCIVTYTPDPENPSTPIRSADWKLMYNVEYRPHSFRTAIFDRDKKYGFVYNVCKEWVRYVKDKTEVSGWKSTTYKHCSNESSPSVNDVRWNVNRYECWDGSQWNTFTLTELNDTIISYSQDLPTQAEEGTVYIKCKSDDSIDMVYGYQSESSQDTWIEVPTYIRRANVAHTSSLPSDDPINTVRLVNDNNTQYAWNGTQWDEVIVLKYVNKVNSSSELPSSDIIQGSVYAVVNENNYYFRNNHTSEWKLLNTDTSDMIISLNVKDYDATDKGGRIKSKSIEGINQGKYPVREVLFESKVDDVRKLPLLIHDLDKSLSTTVSEVSTYELINRNWVTIELKGTVETKEDLDNIESKVKDDLYYVQSGNIGYYQYDGQNWVKRNSSEGNDTAFNELTDVSINYIFKNTTSDPVYKHLKSTEWKFHDIVTSPSATISGDIQTLGNQNLTKNSDGLLYNVTKTIYSFGNILQSGSKWKKLRLMGLKSAISELPNNSEYGDCYMITTVNKLYAYLDTESGKTWYPITVSESYSSYDAICLPNNNRNYYLDKLVVIEDSNGYSCYLTAINGDGNKGGDGNRGSYKWHKVISYLRLKVVNRITAPTYVMSQASGYKLVSNKELPASPEVQYPSTGGESVTQITYDFIPWIMNYFAANTNSTSSTGAIVKTATENLYQHSPMYIKYTFDSNANKAIIDVKQVIDIYQYGKKAFNFNAQRVNMSDILYFEHTLNNI